VLNNNLLKLQYRIKKYFILDYPVFTFNKHKTLVLNYDTRGKRDLVIIFEFFKN